MQELRGAPVQPPITPVLQPKLVEEVKLERLLEGCHSSNPVVLQVGQLGESYQSWVHRPVKGQPRFFASPTLDAITKTPWWIVPLLWGPIILILLWMSVQLEPSWKVAPLVLIGYMSWHLLEYGFHRGIFHTIPNNYYGITCHFVLHGCHHKFPMDGLRLVFPPLPAALIASAIYATLRAFLAQGQALPVMTGILVGYLIYDCTHYILHHGGPQTARHMRRLRKAHMSHHYTRPDVGFGISTSMLDALLGTQSIAK